MPQDSKGESVSGQGWNSFLLLIWFVAAAAVFTLLYKALDTRIAGEDNFTKVIGHVGWPFVIFALSFPAVLLLASNLRQLLGLKAAIEQAPARLEESLVKAQGFRDSIVQIQNDLTEALEKAEARATALAEKMRSFAERIEPRAEAAPVEPSPRERLAEHLELATPKFYAALETWNSDGRRRNNVLVVTRGGGNRPELVDELERASLFDADPQRNALLASYIRTAFREQMSTRRREVDGDTIAELDAKLRDLEQQGLNLAE